jgi:hypothetical protein
VALALAISKQMEIEKVNTMNKKNQNKRSNTMRRSIYLFALLTLFVVGCSEESSVLSPVNDVSISEPNWIALPQAVGMQAEKISSSQKSINGAIGATWKWNTSYTGTLGRVTIDFNMVFKPNSFSGTKTITQSHDDATCVSTFNPSMVFNTPVICTVTYAGLDLSGINPSTVKFAYLAANGSVQYASHEGITVNLSTKTLSVKNAKIPHFSRYGFVN